MASWSPLKAMKAYVHTLQLCKEYNGSKLLEPKCIEYISALAAGSQARVMVDVTASEGMSPSTLALAIAARYTGGKLVCLCRDERSIERAKAQIDEFGLGGAVSFKACADPREAMRECKNVDFAVVDRRVEGCEEVLFSMDLNPKGSMLVLSNLFEGRRAVGDSCPSMRMIERGGAESAILPIGGGMEVIKFGRRCKRSSSRRTFLVYEEK